MKKLLLLLLLLYPLSAAAETYQWTDERGTVNFAEDLGKVPKKYRKKAKLLGSDDAEPAAPAVVTAPESAGPKGGEIQKGKQVYGGKDEAAWRREFLQASSNLQNAETEVLALKRRLDDTSKMSRSEYLLIQTSIRQGESRVEVLQRSMEQLRETADRLGVPAEFRQ